MTFVEITVAFNGFPDTAALNHDYFREDADSNFFGCFCIDI